MAKLTKKQFEEMFREEVLPYVADRYEQDGIPDKPARSEAWNDTIDAYIREMRVRPAQRARRVAAFRSSSPLAYSSLRRAGRQASIRRSTSPRSQRL
jgi:hypothetical protein